MSSPGHSLGDPAPHQLRPPDGQSPPKGDDQRVVVQTPHHELQPPDTEPCFRLKPPDGHSPPKDDRQRVVAQTPHHELQPPDTELCLPEPDDAGPELHRDSALFDSAALGDIEYRRLGCKLSGVKYRDNL